VIARAQITSIVKACLPQVREDVADQMTEEIVLEVEAITRTLIRQKVADQRKQLYTSSLKNWESADSAFR